MKKAQEGALKGTLLAGLKKQAASAKHNSERVTLRLKLLRQSGKNVKLIKPYKVQKTPQQQLALKQQLLKARKNRMRNALRSHLQSEKEKEKERLSTGTQRSGC